MVTTPSDIGAMAEGGPGGRYAGHIMGLLPALHLAGDIGGIAVGAAVARHQAKRAKDFNDQPADRNVGVDDGEVVNDGGTRRRRSTYPGHPPWMPEP